MRNFLTDQSGAVTVDWTVLTASVVGLGLSTAVAVRTGAVSLGADFNGALSGAQVAMVMQADDPYSDLNLSSADGYLDMQFYFFNSTGQRNWYRNNVQNLSDADLLAALDTRQSYMESEMAMGPNDAPSYGEPWGHTDMYNLTRWEAAYRGLI